MKEKLKFFSKIRRVLTIVGIFCGLSLANAVSSANYIPPVPGNNYCGKHACAAGLGLYECRFRTS